MQNNQLISDIEDIIALAEKLKNAYFFTPPARAADRRAYEDRHTTDTVYWTDGDDNYSARYSVVCTCTYIDARGHYYRNGNKTTLTAIRNSLKRLKAANKSD